MREKRAPYIDDIRLHLADDAGHAILAVKHGTKTTELAVAPDTLMLLIGKLQHLNAEMETRRKQIDPSAGKAGDSRPLTAIRPTSVQTASVPGTDEAAIIFETRQGPQAFAIPRAAMTEVAQKLLREAKRTPQKPPLSS